MSDLLVNIKEGAVKGVLKENVAGGKYIVFQGIPYAAPPVGNLRFQDPQPPLPWTGIRKYLEKEKKAAQIHGRTGEITGEDDCLYLNVATNSLSGKKAVLVWIHGGAYSYSSSDLNYFGPDYLLKHDIVFVSFNYRLGIFGFLNLNIEDCSGNQGLKDQVYVLKWIQENIEAFGGDRQNVTIFGASSGASAVHYLCISPLARGLFQKACCQSGVIVNPNNFQISNKELAFNILKVLGRKSSILNFVLGLFQKACCQSGVTVNPNNFQISNQEFAFNILEDLGKKTSDPREAVKLFRSFSTRDILQAELKLVENLNAFFIKSPFLPTLDFASANPFLPQPIKELIKDGISVPLIIGFNDLDGIAVNYDKSEKTMEMLDKKFEEILESRLNLNNLINVPKFAREVRKFYFNNNSITIKEAENLLKFRGDVSIINGTQFIAEIQRRKKTPTFMYKFTYKLDDSVISRDPICKNFQGAGHAEENHLLFYRPLLGKERQLKNGTKDYLMMQLLTKLWTNFAKTGDPTSEIDDLVNTKWKPISASHKFYLEIGTQIFLGENPGEKSWEMWKPIWCLKEANCNLQM